ncbi:MAG: sugar ABC transporter substrate-binding protein [Lachnospiraceae bacterium]
MKRKIMAVMVMMVMVFSLTACGGSDSSETSGDASGDSSGDSGDIEIAYIVKAKTDEFWTSMEKGAYAYAEANGVELSFQAPEKETDVEKQVQMVENAVTKGVDAIILSAADSKSLVPSIVKANNAGIPVILVNDTIDEDALEAEGGHVETYVGIDQYEAAALAGTYAAENIKDGKIAYLEGISGVAAHEDRLNGFKDQVADFEIVSSQTAKCDRNEAFNVMQNVLSANSDVNVVWAINAEMGQGAIQAIEQGGFSGKVQVFDFDASSDDIEAIKSGTLTGSVAQFPDLQAEAAIQACLDVLDGKALEEHTVTKAELITAENVEEFEAGQ